MVEKKQSEQSVKVRTEDFSSMDVFKISSHQSHS